MNDKITIEDVNLHYGSFHALKDITLHIPEREITAFIGPLRLRQIHAPEVAQPDERSGRGM